jgi:uncharacterized protein YlxW (UPF0749 family)
MELNTLLLFLAILACPLCIGTMMWMMNRNMGGQQNHSMSDHTMHTSETDRLKSLRKQRQQLEQEITEVEKILALEEKKQTLLQDGVTDGIAKQ